MLKSNFHTHTTRCHHAYGSDEEYVLAAIEAGYDVLGFADHTPWKYNNANYISNVRMQLSEFENYYQSLKALQTKYQDKIKILIGLEAEYYPEYMDWYKQFIKEHHLDYVIFGNHYHQDDQLGIYYGYACEQDKYLDMYLEDIKQGVQAGIYSYIAHPDLFMRGRKQFDAKAREVSYELCRFCKEHDVVLEYNLGGARVSKKHGVVEYPHPEFWEIASEVGNKVIIGVDAHSPQDLLDDSYYQEALAYLQGLDLEIIDMIDIDRF